MIWETQNYVIEDKDCFIAFWNVTCPYFRRQKINESNSLVVRQKGEPENGCYKKAKHVKISEKRTFLTPWYADVCMFVFWKIWWALFSCNTRFEIRPFGLLRTSYLTEINLISGSFLSSLRPATLSKRDPGTIAFLWTLGNF